MTKVALTDGSGAWFDDDKAVKFDEATWWNGNNRISTATGSQWNHEGLYWTAKGGWILSCTSQYQNVAETHEAIAQDAAVVWLSRNEAWDSSEFDKLPEDVREAVKAGLEALEM